VHWSFLCFCSTGAFLVGNSPYWGKGATLSSLRWRAVFGFVHSVSLLIKKIKIMTKNIKGFFANSFILRYCVKLFKKWILYMIIYVEFKTALIATLMATSAFASSVPSEEDERARSTLVHVPMSAGGFDALPSDAMGYLVSCMPVYKLEEAQNFVLVCKYFHTHVVPRMRLSWTPKRSVIPSRGSFAHLYAPRVVILDLSYDATFAHNHLQGFANLTSLDLAHNKTVTNKELMHLTNLTHLGIKSNHTVTNEGLKSLPNLTSLNLDSNHTVTDKDLTSLTNLRDLSLMDNNIVTDKGIMHLTNLRDLSLMCNSTVTNEGIQSLSNLTSLNLNSNTTVTNEAVMLLTSLTHLELYYNDTVTSAGYAHLPNLHVAR
jgi:hypothetical protein